MNEETGQVKQFVQCHAEDNGSAEMILVPMREGKTQDFSSMTLAKSFIFNGDPVSTPAKK